ASVHDLFDFSSDRRSSQIFILRGSVAHRALHSFPTRRSSDLFPESGGLWRARPTDSNEISRRQNGANRKRFLRQETQHRCCCPRSEEHTSELQSPYDLVCRLLLEKKKI